MKRDLIMRLMRDVGDAVKEHQSSSRLKLKRFSLLPILSVSSTTKDLECLYSSMRYGR